MEKRLILLSVLLEIQQTGGPRSDSVDETFEKKGSDLGDIITMQNPYTRSGTTANSKTESVTGVSERCCNKMY